MTDRTKNPSQTRPVTRLADGREISYEKMLVMGILNVTPDSFYGASRAKSLKDGLNRAEAMLTAGADILDIGGESTRPGSDPVSCQEERQRVVPLITEIKKKFSKTILSVDTYRAATAEAALDAGADIINDISAMTYDDAMVSVAAKEKAPVILMHMQGTPKTMQAQPAYEDVVREVGAYLRERAAFALTQGLTKEQLIVDPGIGFGKTATHNLTLLKHLDQLADLGVPVLLAASRKNFIGKALGDLPPEDRLEGTLATTAQAMLCGAHIVRVHDVAAHVRFIRMMEAIQGCQ